MAQELGKRCVVCRFFYSTLGQQVGTVWGVWGPGFQVCKHCVQAGRDERRKREHETVNQKQEKQNE